MQRNVGYLDRAIRLGAAMACAAVAYNREARDVWFGLVLAVGVAALFTGLFSFSLLYAWLGISTRESRPGKDQ
jgi:hypothetical protein